LIDFLDEKREYLKESAEFDILKWDHYVASGNGRQGWGGGGMFGRKNENFEVSVIPFVVLKVLTGNSEFPP
jgi:hypothetical protein